MTSPALPRTVLTRVISAVALGIPVLAAIWTGTPAFELMVVLAAVILAWEWFGMCGGSQPTVAGVLLGGALLCAIAATIWTGAEAGLVALALGAGAVLLSTRGRSWLGLGTFYLGVPCIALLWLRGHGAFGRDVVLWMMAVVWATDTGAYAAGRSIGGPKLLPRVSPRKTWAGLIGGVALGALVGLIVARLQSEALLALAALLGLLVALVSQAGDLLESWIKRRCGVKDASTLIPGHGGLLDRIDGMMAAALAVAGMAAAGGGAVFRWL